MVYKHSQEIKDKLREMNLGENNPMFNKTHTEEAKEKIRQANTGENNPLINSFLVVPLLSFFYALHSFFYPSKYC